MGAHTSRRPGGGVLALAFVGGGLAALAAAAWAGLRVRPRPWPEEPPSGADRGRVDIPADLPPPVRWHLERIAGSHPPRVDAVVSWGRGRIRQPVVDGLGLTVPIRWRARLEPGRRFRWDAEMTWYGRTFLRGGDEYGDGRGRLVMGKAVMEGPAMDRAEATVLWLNTLWLAPTALLTDPRVRWEPVDDVTARLVVPALPTDVASDGGAGDVAVLTLAFDPSTGALARVSTQRMDPALDAPRPYTAALDAYRPAGPLDVATEVRARWDDELAVELTLDGAVANPVPDTE